ncbi:MAG: porin [Balneola sp.]|nr:MAG: porin [Balneola sp.]
MRKYLVEAVGTFFLALSMGLTTNPLAIGLLLAGLIYGGMHVSGAHFNPAISFAYLLKKRISFGTFSSYFVSQCLGVFAAGGLILFFSNEVFYVEPPASTDLYQQAGMELLLTFVLALTYLSVATDKVLASNKAYGLAIGLVLSGLIMLGDSISGAVLNPAISIGLSAIDFLAIRGASYEFIPLYLVSPIAGATLAALFHQYINNDYSSVTSR